MLFESAPHPAEDEEAVDVDRVQNRSRERRGEGKKEGRKKKTGVHRCETTISAQSVFEPVINLRNEGRGKEKKRGGGRTFCRSARAITADSLLLFEKEKRERWSNMVRLKELQNDEWLPGNGGGKKEDGSGGSDLCSLSTYRLPKSGVEEGERKREREGEGTADLQNEPPTLLPRYGKEEGKRRKKGEEGDAG